MEPDDLVAAAAAYAGKGAKLARRAARYVRAGVDSAMESRLRMLLVLAGLPEPTVNFIVRHADGRIWMRFDLYYAAYGLLVEYDGRQHAENSKQWLHDIARRERLDSMRLRLLIVTKDDFYDAPEQVLVRVRDALIERGATGIRRTFLPGMARTLCEPVLIVFAHMVRNTGLPTRSALVVAHVVRNVHRAYERGWVGFGAVSERMSMRQPVSRAAKRAFWPSRPMASDNW